MVSHKAKFRFTPLHSDTADIRSKYLLSLLALVSVPDPTNPSMLDKRSGNETILASVCESAEASSFL